MTSSKLFRPALFLAAALVLGEIAYVTLGPNYFAVVPGQCYRSAQPSAAFVEEMVTKRGIGTIVNLRGPNAGKDWYDAERGAAEKLGVPMIDIALASNFPPSTAEFRQLIDAMDHSSKPILLHCHSGADRTGLASMMYLLLHSDRSLAQARGQISLRYGHKFWSDAVQLHAIPDAYAAWLEGQNKAHTPEAFREWGLTVYRRADICERLGFKLLPPGFGVAQ
jgi:protein tyrosine phosphatase (PTP) superfamily phosphohydrolase (DUF442 family)